VGAAWLQPQVGRTATLWQPVLAGGVERRVARNLAQHALAASTTLSTVLAQALLDSPDNAFADDLLALEFLHLADLKYLTMAVPRHADPPPATTIRLADSTQHDEQLLAELIRETYHATLDCPQLEGRRDIHDVLA